MAKKKTKEQIEAEKRMADAQAVPEKTPLEQFDEKLTQLIQECMPAVGPMLVEKLLAQHQVDVRIFYFNTTLSNTVGNVNKAFHDRINQIVQSKQRIKALPKNIATSKKKTSRVKTRRKKR